jgi:hypothetical protein
VVKDLVEAPPLILKINGGLAEIVHLLLLLAVLVLLVLEFLLEEGVFWSRISRVASAAPPSQ